MEKTYNIKANGILEVVEQKITEHTKQELLDRKMGLLIEMAEVNLLLSKFKK